MTTVTKIREEIADEFTEHIVSIDHNVIDKYDPEFSFHIVCHPEVDDEGRTNVPQEIVEFVEEIASDTDVRMHEMHVHLYIEVSDETLGIDDSKAVQTQYKSKE